MRLSDTVYFRVILRRGNIYRVLYYNIYVYLVISITTVYFLQLQGKGCWAWKRDLNFFYIRNFRITFSVSITIIVIRHKSCKTLSIRSSLKPSSKNFFLNSHNCRHAHRCSRIYFRLFAAPDRIDNDF